MGPALMDDKWIYGSDPANIFETIVEGPSEWDAFLWQQDTAATRSGNLVSYVRSMSGLSEERRRPEPERQHDGSSRPKHHDQALRNRSRHA